MSDVPRRCMAYPERIALQPFFRSHHACVKNIHRTSIHERIAHTNKGFQIDIYLKPFINRRQQLSKKFYSLQRMVMWSMPASAYTAPSGTKPARA